MPNFELTLYDYSGEFESRIIEAPNLESAIQLAKDNGWHVYSLCSSDGVKKKADKEPELPPLGTLFFDALNAFVDEKIANAKSQAKLDKCSKSLGIPIEAKPEDSAAKRLKGCLEIWVGMVEKKINGQTR